MSNVFDPTEPPPVPPGYQPPVPTLPSYTLPAQPQQGIYSPPAAPIRQSRDKAQYVRQQKGHSWLLHWVVLGVFTCFIVPLYYTFSPNHYWHL